MALVFDDPSIVFDINKGMILEASAGSGKTTILTERWLATFLYLIVWQQKSISEALGFITALTFTRKAADEMRVRIRSRINELWNSDELFNILNNIKIYAGEYPDTLENIVFSLKKQQNIINDLVSGATITTINAFVLKALRSHPLELDLDIGLTPEENGTNISIAEREAQLEVFRNLLQNKYHSTIQELFYLGIKLCGMSKWNKLFENVRFMVFNYGDQAVEQGLINSGYLLYQNELSLLDSSEKSLQEIWNLLKSPVEALLYSLEKEMKYKNKLTRENNEFYKKLKNLDSLVSLFSKDLLGQYKYPKPVKDEELNLLRENCQYAYQYFVDTLYRVMIPLILPISDLCSKQLHEIQKENGEISFGESEILFAKALQNKSFFNKINSRIKYLFTDEYQDTSDLQKSMFDMLLSDNQIIPFFVGDPKQSIYSFRKANVQVFQQTIREFQERNYQYKFLNTNYRSAQSHVEFINYIFSDVFHDDYANIRYQAQISNKSEVGKFSYTLALGADNQEKYLTQDRLKQAYNDALFLINEYCAKGISPGEIMVLFRNKKSILEFYQFVKEYAPHIPLSSSVRYILWDNPIITPLLSFLRVLVYPHQNLMMIELLKTPFFRKTDTEINWLLYEGREKKQSIFECLNEEDSQIIKEFILLRDRIPLEELINLLIQNTNYEDILFALPEAGDNIASLRLFLDEIQTLQERRNMALIEFINYIDNKQPYINEAEFSGEEGKTLRLMTIHSAKGLESPYVIYIHKASEREKRPPYPLYCQGKISFDIFGKGLIAAQLEEEFIQNYLSEEKRLAYVALTRAKLNFDFCALPSRMKNNNSSIKTQWASFLNKELIESHALYVQCQRQHTQVNKISYDKETINWQKYQDRYCELKQKDENFYRQEIPQFLSVSLLLDVEFNKNKFHDKYMMHSFEILNSFRELSEEEFSLNILGNKEIGSLTHLLLQEFDEPHRDEVQCYLLNNHKDKCAIFDQVLDYAYGYWNSDFYQTIKKNKCTYDKERQVLGLLKEGMIIRATADLYISSNNKKTIVDYKLSVNNNLERYYRQLTYYALLSEWAGYSVDELVLFSLKEAEVHYLEWDKQKTTQLFNKAVTEALNLLTEKNDNFEKNDYDEYSLLI